MSFHSLRRHGVGAALLVSALALGLEWSVRDGIPVVSAFAYATPMPLVAFVALACAAWTLPRERWEAFSLSVVMLVCSATTHLVTAVEPPRARSAAEPAAEPAFGAAPIRGLVWNAWRARPGLDRAIAEIRRHRPDVFVLVEPPVDARAEPLVALRTLMPEYAFGFVGKRFVVAARDAVEIVDTDDDDGLRTARARVKVADVALDVLCVDVGSNPFRSRRARLLRIAELAREVGVGPVLVMGDFNTPRRSVHFGPLRETFTHAFEASGEGFDATWPEPFPVHAIDHAWGNDRVRFVACDVAPTNLSDHRPVVFSFVTQRSD